MKVQVLLADPFDISTQLLMVGCFEEEPGDERISCLDRKLMGALTAISQQKEFTGSFNSIKILHTLGRLPAERVVLVGLGKRQLLTPARVMKAAGTASRALKATGVVSCSTFLHQCGGEEQAYMRAVVEGIMLGQYAFDYYRTQPDDRPALSELNLLVGAKSEIQRGLAIATESRIVCEAVSLVRNLVSHPGNVATPAYLAEQALTVSARYDLSCHVMGCEELEQLGMNGLLFVGKGSLNSPRFIIMEYCGGAKKDRPVVIVGKGITFDSGGISLKPREGMERMKDDMAGAATVIGTMQAAAALKMPVNLVGLVPAAENMPDGRSYKPGDIIRTMSGKTVEITNTDAEGRMVLCDALHYAKRYKPSALIDIATLTGACLVALGTEASGLMGSDDGLKKALKRAGEATGERLWELPVWEEYGESMKSDIADMKNSGGPHAGVVTAAWFLSQFVGKTKWAHLDIAGTAWEENGRHYLPKGATGVGVRLLVEYLRGL